MKPVASIVIVRPHADPGPARAGARPGRSVGEGKHLDETEAPGLSGDSQGPV